MNRRQLAPRARGVFRYSELWLEDDQLLYRSSTRFAERYLRFKLADVQGIVCTYFPLWTPFRIFWLASSLVFSLALLTLPPGNWKWTSLPFVISLLWALADLIPGPRCRVVIHTAVSAVAIDALGTAELAGRVLPELRQRIEFHQGSVAAGNAATAFSQAAAPPAAQRSVLLAQVLFGVLLIHAILLGIFYATNQMGTGASVSGTLLLAEVIMGVIAGLRASSMGIALAGACTLAAAFALIDGGFLTFSIFSAVAAFFEQARTARPENIELPWLREQTVFRCGWHALIGLGGWIVVLMRGDRR
jgi:hypothetical protein